MISSTTHDSRANPLRYSMVTTGKWSVPDLIEYFVKVESSLTQDEWQYIEQMHAFFAEPASDNDRFIASDLHEPLDALRKLGVPVLKWDPPMTWRSQSDYGMLGHISINNTTH